MFARNFAFISSLSALAFRRTMASQPGVTTRSAAAAGVGQTDIISHLTKRHKEVDEELSILESTDDVSERQETLNKLVQDLSVHTAVEERIFYPAIQDELGPKNPKLFAKEVLSLLEEHHAAKTVLDELYTMGADAERFKARASFLAKNVRDHVKEEEDLFPRLREYWPESRLRELADEFIYAEKSAPTRPHPMLPDQGRFMASMQFMYSALDKIKDAARNTLHNNAPTESDSTSRS